MNKTAIKQISKTLEEIMSLRGISAKELAAKSGVSYSSLIPILSGSRDFGVSKLIALTNALGCSPDAILAGTYPHSSKDKHPSKTRNEPKFLVAFVSAVAITYCMIYDVSTNNTTINSLQFPLRCGQDPDTFLDEIINSVNQLTKPLIKNINLKDFAVYLSVQQYCRTGNRKKIQKLGNFAFHTFIMEPDAITNHKALFSQQNGICITINYGDAITYSVDNSRHIIKHQGYGFPISDIAGNYWIGCEAIKHALNVKEGIEQRSLLSDKILAHFNNNKDLLSEYTMINPEKAYLEASNTALELLHFKKKSYEIIKKSANLIKRRVTYIDKKTNEQLPIIITGDLAHAYENFFQKNRLLSLQDSYDKILLNYGISELKKLLQTNKANNT
ncbi:MAG: helix-turn-helix domain-containing protein [Gammaproteobacteria bacterium]|nr:helix-turn-helix domain-containing protein [Gammaproteobacteria bacterium]